MDLFSDGSQDQLDLAEDLPFVELFDSEDGPACIISDGYNPSSGSGSYSLSWCK